MFRGILSWKLKMVRPASYSPGQKFLHWSLFVLVLGLYLLPYATRTLDAYAASPEA
jgi:cytochrome b561